MFIINNQADYSDCGIGKVYPLTNAIKNLLIAGYGDNVTLEQMFAFQQFAGAIGWGKSDLYDKIKLLTIPVFNGNAQDTGVFYNLKTGTKAIVGQATDTMTIRDDNFTSYWSLSQNGAHPIYRNVANEMLRFCEFTPAPKDFSLICVFANSETGAGLQNSNGVPIAVDETTLIYRKYDGSTLLQINNVANDGILVASSQNDGDDAVYTKNTISEQSGGVTLSSSGTLYPNYGMWSNFRPNSVPNPNPMFLKVYGYAVGLTKNEAKTLRDALSILAEDLSWSIGYIGD